MISVSRRRVCNAQPIQLVGYTLLIVRGYAKFPRSVTCTVLKYATNELRTADFPLTIIDTNSRLLRTCVLDDNLFLKREKSFGF